MVNICQPNLLFAVFALWCFWSRVLFVRSAPQTSSAEQVSEIGLLFRKSLEENPNVEFLIEFISLLIGDTIAPKEYDGAYSVEINQKLRSALEVSKSALHLAGISFEDISKIKACLERVQFGNDDSDQEELISQQIDDLKFATSFKDCTNSVILRSGTKTHACLCEIMKMKLNENNKVDDNNGVEKLVFLIYNSGDGIKYHYQKNIDFKKRYSPVMIFTKEMSSLPANFILNWLEFHLMLKRLRDTSMDFFYQVLFGHLDLVPFDDEIYNTFMPSQVTGTCTVSCYHSYFSYKLGLEKYNQIKTIISARSFFAFISQTNPSFLDTSMLKKNEIYFNDNNILTTSESNYQPCTVFELPRWNINFIDWVIRLLFRWTSENFPNKIIQNELQRFTLNIYRDFKTKSEIFLDKNQYNFHKSMNVFDCNFTKLQLNFKSSKQGPSIEGNVVDVEPTELMACNLPKTTGTFMEFVESFSEFLLNEERIDGCFDNNTVPSIAFFQSLNIEIIRLVNDIEDWKKEDNIFFKMMNEYIKFVNRRYDWSESSEFLTEKIEVHSGIIYIYRTALIKYYQSKLEKESDKKNIRLFFQKFVPIIFTGFACLSLSDLHRIANLNVQPQKSLDFSEFCKFFFGEKETNEKGFYNFFEDILKEKYSDKKRENSEEIWAYEKLLQCRQVKNDEHSRNKFFELLQQNCAVCDSEYYYFIENILKIDGSEFKLEIQSPVSNMTGVHVFLTQKLTPTSRKGGIPDFKYGSTLKEIYDFCPRSESENKATIQHLKEKNKISISNVISQENPLASWLGFITIVEEDEKFIISPKGIYFLYVLLVKESEPRFLFDLQADLKKTLIRFFQYKQAQLLVGFSSKPKYSIEILATYQIILQRLGIYQCSLIRETLGEEFIKNERYEPVFSFLSLREKIQKIPKNSYFEDLISDYLQTIEGIGMVKQCFHEYEIIDVLFGYIKIFIKTKTPCVVPYAGYDQFNLISGRRLKDEKSRVESIARSEINNHFLNDIGLSSKLCNSISYKKNSSSYFRLLNFESLDLMVSGDKVFLRNGDTTSQELLPMEGCSIKFGYLSITEFDNRLFGYTKKLYFARVITQDKENCFLIDSSGQKYGNLKKDSDSGYTFELLNPEIFVDKGCLPQEFKFSVFKFRFLENETLCLSFEKYSLLQRFCLNTIISYLESSEKSKDNYILFANYAGEYKDLYAIQNEESFCIHFGGKIYEIISNKDTYKEQVLGRKMKLAKESEKIEDLSISFDYYNKNFPVLFLKDISDEFQTYAIVSFPKKIETNQEYEEFNFYLIDCDEYLNFKDISLFGRLVLVYSCVYLKYFEEALRFALAINPSIDFFLDNELKVLKLIQEIEYRDVEAKLFAAWASYIKLQNGLCHDKKTEVYYNLENLYDVFQLCPSIYSQFSSIFFPNLFNQDLISMNMPLIEQLDIRKQDVEFLTGNYFQEVSESLLYDCISKYRKTSSETINLEIHTYISNDVFDDCISDILAIENFDELKKTVKDQYETVVRFYRKDGSPDFRKYLYVFYHVLYEIFFHSASSEKKCKNFIKDLKEMNTYDMINIKKFTESIWFLYERVAESKSSKNFKLPDLIEIDTKNSLSNAAEIKSSARNCLLSKKLVFEGCSKLPLFGIFGISVEEAAKFFDKFTNNYDDLLKLTKILLCPSKEKLQKYFPKEFIDHEHETLVCFWEHYLQKYWNQSPKFISDAMEKIFIVFEVNTGIKPSEKQKRALRDISSSLQNDKSIVYQWTMGGGKTSVFGTCLAAYSAKVLGRLPVFIFPKSILDTNVHFMNDRLWKAFCMKLFKLKMQRSSYYYSLNYLSFVFYQLITYHESQEGAIVCSPETIQCFLNARKELFIRMNEAKDQDEQLEKQFHLISKILYFLKEYTTFIIDEIDSVMNLTKSLNFNTHHVKKHDQAEIDEIIEVVYQYKDHWRKGRFNNTTAKITAHNFKRKDLIEACSMKLIHVNYGPSFEKSVPYVVPYESTKNPSEGSTYSDFWFSLALSVKYYLEEDFKQRPNWMNDQIFNQFSKMFQGESQYSEFHDIWNKRVIDNFNNFGKFLNFFVLPSIITYERQYCCSAIDFILTPSRFVGYSGTLYDKKILEDIFKGKIKINTDDGISTESRIVAALKLMFDESRQMIEYATKPDKAFRIIEKSGCKAIFDAGSLFKDYKNLEMARELLELEGGKLYEKVYYYHDNYNLLYCISKNDNGELIEKAISNTIVNQGKTVLYLDQSHTVGTDIELDNDALCITTVSTDLVSIKDFLQALLRARKLLEGIQFEDGKIKIDKSEERQQMRFISMGTKSEEKESIKKSDEFNNLMRVFDTLNIEKISDNKELRELYESCVNIQVKRNSAEEQLLERALFFAKATENLFKYKDEPYLKITANELKELEWVIYFEDPMPSFSTWVDSNIEIWKNYLNKIDIQDICRLKSSNLDGTVEVLNEQSQEMNNEIQDIRNQLNQNRILWNQQFESCIKPNPSCIVRGFKSDMECFSQVRATIDWSLVYSEDPNSPLDQGKIPIFLWNGSELGKLNEFGLALVSLEEANSLHSKQKSKNVFTLGALGFDEGLLSMYLDVLLQYLAFSGSFSAFNVLLEEWSFEKENDEKFKIFGTIMKTFQQSGLESELMRRSILFDKEKSLFSYLSFRGRYSHLAQYAINNKIIVNIVPNSDEFIRKLEIQIMDEI